MIVRGKDNQQYVIISRKSLLDIISYFAGMDISKVVENEFKADQDKIDKLNNQLNRLEKELQMDY